MKLNDVSFVNDLLSAEINLFHKQRVADYKEMMQNFLREQINFYQGVSVTVCSGGNNGDDRW